MKFVLAFLSLLLACLVVVAPVSAQVNSGQTFRGRIVAINETSLENYTPGQDILTQSLQVRLNSGSREGEVVVSTVNRFLSTGESQYQIGDQVMVNILTAPDGEELVYIIDYVRIGPLFSLFALFATLVIVVARTKGLTSLLGLASTFIIIGLIIIPGLQSGYSPIFVAIVGSLMIMLITFYLTHGVNEKTTIAIAGTFISLVITAVLATVYLSLAKITGFAAEEAAFLQVIKGGDLNIQGLLLAGIIIGALGVLDDITISQASVVRELKLANPKIKAKKLYSQAMNIGRDHIASLVNTLVLVYTGGALPLLLLFTLDESRSFSTVINYEIIAEEIVRTLVASIGLITAVPITTFIAANFGFRHLDPHAKSESHHHH